MPNIRLIFLVFIIATIHATHMSSAQSSEINKLPNHYYISVDATNIHAAVKLNGAPLIQHNEGTGIVTERPVTTWLNPGKNSLEVAVFALPEEETIRGSITVKVFLHDNNSDFPKPKHVYTVLEYPNEKEVPTDKIDYVSKSFSFTEALSVNLWNEAEKISSISYKDEIEISELIEELRMAIVSNDIDTAIAMQAYKINEDAFAEGKEASQIIEATKHTYEWLTSQKNLKSEAIEKENLTFQLIANQQVVYATKKNGENALRLDSQTMGFEIPIYVSKINNKWTLVR